MFGVLCAFNAFFELLPLIQAANGRVSRKVVPGPMQPDAGKQTFSVIVETPPFFDPTQNWIYNLQSACMIFSPLTFLFGAILANKTFNIMQNILDGGIDPFGTAAWPPGQTAF